MRGATGTGDDDLDSAAGSFLGVVEHPLRRAVRRDDTDLEADTELGQSFGCSFHGRPIRIAAHDQADLRALTHRVHPIRRSKLRTKANVLRARRVPELRQRNSGRRWIRRRRRC